MSGSLAWVYAQTSSPWSSGCSAGLLCLSPSTVHSQHLPETSQGLLTIPTLHCSLYLMGQVEWSPKTDGNHSHAQFL